MNYRHVNSIEEVIRNKMSYAFVTGDSQVLSIWRFSMMNGVSSMGTNYLKYINNQIPC